TLKRFQFELFGKTFYFTSIIANALNVIVLTAALSVYNSCVYSNSRMLYGLAEQGNAPKFLKKLNSNHSPVNAILVSAGIVAITVLINKVIPKEALGILMSLVVSALIINWIMITLTHMFFRKQKDKQGIKTKFPTILYPISNYFSLLFLLGVLLMMWFTGLKISVELIPIWVLLLWISYILVKRNKEKQLKNTDN